MGTTRLPADEILKYAEQNDADYDAPIAKLVPEVKPRHCRALNMRSLWAAAERHA
jgi:hypothetical protein